MTTTTADPPRTEPRSAASEALNERYERLPIESIVPSKTNPRHYFDVAYLEQLTTSVRKKGVLEPLLVRQVDAGSHKPMKFEIVAGECRYKAAKAAGLTHLPALIRLLTDEQALEHQLIENLHRRDLTPLEEAAGFRALIKANPDKHSAATIASRIGKSTSWVWDLMKLLDLIPEAKAILEQGLMMAGHAILIARLKPEDQKRVVDPGARNGFNHQREGLWQYQGGALEFETKEDERKHKPGKYDDLKAVSIRELDDWIKTHIRFDVAHMAKAQPLAFEQTAAVVEEAAAEPGRGRKVISITHKYHVADDARDADERTYGSQSWERADGKEKSKTCEFSVLGVVVAGRGQGETLQVCVNRDKCTVHFGAVISQREKNQKLREAGKGKQAAKNETARVAKDQQKERDAEAQRKAWEKLEPHVIADAVAQVKTAKTITPARAKALFESDLWNHDALVLKHLGANWYKTPAAAWLVGGVVQSYSESFEHYVKTVAKPFGLDVKRLEAIRDKHQPKAEPAQTSGVKKTKGRAARA